MSRDRVCQTALGGKPYCLPFDDVTMFTQPKYDVFVKLAKFEAHYGIDVFW